MQTAHRRDAVLNEKFYFRKDVREGSKDEMERMTVNEIVNGSQGLVSIVRQYLDSMETDQETRCTLEKYIELISKRASGELMTGAAYIRQLVTSHPDYKQDSVVSSQITYDLLQRAAQIGTGEYKARELTGDF